MFGCVYALSDPRAPRLPLYYGKTVGSLARRLWEHLSAARTGKPWHRDQAIRKMRAEGVKPLIWKVEDCATEALLNDAERAWIAAGRAAQRQRISAALRGRKKPPRSVAHRAAMSAAHRKLSKPWLPRGRGRGWHHSAETRAKIAATESKTMTASRLRRETSRDARKDV